MLAESTGIALADLMDHDNHSAASGVDEGEHSSWPKDNKDNGAWTAYDD